MHLSRRNRAPRRPTPSPLRHPLNLSPAQSPRPSPQRSYHPNPSRSQSRHRAPPKPRPAATIPGVGTGVLLDGGIIPAAMLAELIATGATVRPLHEVTDLPTERQYRPSTALTAYVRMTSMTCSFPGCTKPAHRCDLDHVTPWPAGATHPGNLRPLCREHHLLKTFRTGPDGWTMKAHPDGGTEWTAPTGHTYLTTAGAAILFPHWNIHTNVPPPRPISLIHDDHRDALMPTRQRTRAQDREYRINAERARNATELALAHTTNNHTRTNQRPAPGYFDHATGRATISDPDPPPF